VDRVKTKYTHRSWGGFPTFNPETKILGIKFNEGGLLILG